MHFPSPIILFLKSKNQSNLWKINTLFKIWGEVELIQWHKKFLVGTEPFLILYLLFLIVTALKISYNYLCSPKDAFCWFNRLIWFYLWKSVWFWYYASIYIYLHWLLFVIGVSGIWLCETSSVLTAGFHLHQIILFNCRHWLLSINLSFWVFD